MTFLCGYLFLCLSALLSQGQYSAQPVIWQGAYILNIPPKLQQAFDNGNLEPVTYAELITEVLDAPASQNPAISGTNVDLTDTKAIRMNYPDSAGATSVFLDIGKKDQVVARPFGAFAGSGTAIGSQSFVLGEDADAGQAKRLKSISIDISTKALLANFAITCTVFGFSPPNNFSDKNGIPIHHINGRNGFNSLTTYTIPAGTTTKTSIPFLFDVDLIAGKRYAATFYSSALPGGFIASNDFAIGEWYGSRFKTFPKETAVIFFAKPLGDYFNGEFSLKIELAEYDPSLPPVISVKFDLLQTPTEAGEFSILDRNEKIIDAVTGLDQETTTVYNAWTTDATYGKLTGIPLGVIDINDAESLKIQTTELSRYYLLEVALTATDNGLRSPTFKCAIVKFPKTGALARLSSHPLPNFTDPVLTAIKSAPIVPTKMDISKPITKRGKAKLNIVDIGGEITRLAIKQNLLNLTIEIRVGHAPTAQTKDDLALVFAGKITDYTYSEGELSITVEDRTKNLDIRIPRLGTDILRQKRVRIDTGDLQRDWKQDTIPGMLKDILKNESGILSRYIDTASIDAIELNLKAGDTLSPWRTPKEIREPEEASGLIKDILTLIGGYLVSLEDGRIKIIQWPRPGTALGTWDADILTVDDKQPAGLIKSLVNFCMVSFDIKGDGSNKGISAVANADSINEWAPGSEEHVSDRFIKTELLGDQLNYNGETIAHKIADRVVKTYKNGVVPMTVVTPFDQFRFQVGDFISITSPVFLKKFNLGSTARKFMITEKKPDIENNKISWSLMEDINHNRLPTANFTPSISFGTPSFNVTFTDISKHGDGISFTYEWDFDWDGVNFASPADSTLQNPTHTYLISNIGVKRVRLRVTDNLGGQDETERSIRVLGAPTAIINATPSAPDQPPTTLLSSGSYGRTGEIVKTEWDIGYNGVTFVSDFEGESTSVVHLSTDLIVALRVTDEDGLVSAIVTITIPASTRAIVPGVEVSSILTTQWFDHSPAGINPILRGIASSPTQIVIVGQVGLLEAYLISSSDSDIWTVATGLKLMNLHSVVRGPGLFVSVGESRFNEDAYMLTSPDGKAPWTERVNPRTTSLNSVTFGNNLYVAVGREDSVSGNPYITTSVNGMTGWVNRSPATASFQPLNSVTFGNNLYVAVGNADATDGIILTSVDGMTNWTRRSSGVFAHLNGVAYGAGKYVAVGGSNIISSVDGLTAWGVVSSFPAGTYNSVIWNGFIFLAVGSNGGSPVVAGSRDGDNWFVRKTNISTVAFLNAVGWTGSRYLVAGKDSTSEAGRVFSSLSMIGE